MKSLIHMLTLAVERVRVGSQETTLWGGGQIGRQSPPLIPPGQTLRPLVPSDLPNSPETLRADPALLPPQL